MYPPPIVMRNCMDPHKATHFEPPNLLAAFLHDLHDTAATGSASTLCKQFVDPTAQPKSLNAWSSALEAAGVVTRTSDIKDCAKPIDRLVDAQRVNPRVRSCSSHIKSVVAFLKWISPAQGKRFELPVPEFSVAQASALYSAE